MQGVKCQMQGPVPEWLKANCAIPLILASQLTWSGTEESSWRCHFVVMQFVKRPAAFSERRQGGPCSHSMKKQLHRGASLEQSRR